MKVVREILERFRLLPVSTRQLLGVGVILASLVALPLFLWVVLTLKFDIRNLAAENPPLRGTVGDLWADIEVGKRDFGEISPREVVPYKLSAPGGVVVDKSVSPGRMYVWDSGNSRILGIDLARCYSQASPCSADVVIGQPSANDYGACNLDASFSEYPNRIPSSNQTLCGIPESTHTTLEDKSFVSMYVDSSGNLYVPDNRNHRVLKFNNPFTTDTVADEVWGQTDFSGNGCNLSGGIGDGFGGPAPKPTANSLCFITIGGAGGGVTLDSNGNMWVADGGNNRVIRFPKDESGNIAKTADLVLGQPDLTTGGDWSFGDALNRMHSPIGIQFDNLGNLYVADSANSRILKFAPPFTNGMQATTTFGTGFLIGPTAVEIDPNGAGIWIYDTIGWDARLTLWNFEGTRLKELPHLPNRGGGSIGIDTEGKILTSTYVYGQDVHLLTPQNDGTYLISRNLFSPPGGYNLTSSRRLEHSAWTGVGIAQNQLIVSDGRLLFWNDISGLTNGKAADGYVGAGSFTETPNPSFGQVKVDKDNRIWATKRNEIRVYQAPLSIGQDPIKIVASSLNVLGGGQITIDDIQGLAPSDHSEFLWISQPSHHHVLRIRGPLTDTPIVDVVLGQKTTDGNLCNRGEIPAPNQNPGRPASEDAKLDMLCYPGTLSTDRNGNLFVSDHFLESEGNWRLLMFDKTIFPDRPDTVIYGPFATKEFPRTTGTNSYQHMTFEAAFDSQNHMVVGNNPYSGKRFIEYYSDPTRVNPTNPSDPTLAKPDGDFKDFYGWPVAMTFDPDDNLYAYDANRGKIMIYKKPLLATPTPTPSPTPSPSPSPTPSLTPTPRPTCRPRPSCLDATPRCLIPVTSDMCPPTTSPTPTPSSSICVNKCGDGICQNIVCLGSNCPCPESTTTCPQDCRITPTDTTTVLSTLNLPSGRIFSFYRGEIKISNPNPKIPLKTKITALPPGILSRCSSLGNSVNCSLFGWPVKSGTFSVKVSVTDNQGVSIQKTLPMIILSRSFGRIRF